MTDSHDRPDVLDAVGRYAPTRDSVAGEWGPARQVECLAGIVGTGDSVPAGPHEFRPAGEEIPLRFLPARSGASRRRRWTRVAPVAASAAVLAIATGVLIAVVLPNASDDSTSAGARGPASGPVFDPPGGLSAASIGKDQFSHHVEDHFELDADGHRKVDGDAMVARNYVSPDGDIVSVRTGSQTGCTRSPAPAPQFDQASQAFFAALPTDVPALADYLRHHVQGSSSHDEAVFVAVGDMLRTNGALASPRLRAAMVAVLSRTPGVYVHQGQRDYLGRPALRTDFVDQQIRPGEVHSYYFDPASFRFLEERDGQSGQPGEYTGPSPAYTAPAVPAPGDSSPDLTGAAFVDVVTVDKVLDTLPTFPADCTNG